MPAICRPASKLFPTLWRSPFAPAWEEKCDLHSPGVRSRLPRPPLDPIRKSAVIGVTVEEGLGQTNHKAQFSRGESHRIRHDLLETAFPMVQ